MDDLILRIQEYFALYGLRIIGAILLLILGRWGAALAARVAEKVMVRRNTNGEVISFVKSLTYGLLLTFVVIAVLANLGIQTASFVAVIGAAGLAIGLALQGSLANFAAGVLLIIFRPFTEGDFVEAGGVTGVVQDIHIFTTILKTPDNKKVIVPNAKLTSDTITNFSANDTRRVDLVVGVSYSENLDKVRQVLDGIMKADDRILAEPAPTIAVKELGDSSVNFAVRPWVKTADYWDVFFAVTETVKKRFDEENICIPFPQRDVHLLREASAD